MKKIQILNFYRLLKLLFSAIKQIGIEKIIFFLSAIVSESKKSTSLYELERVASYIGIPSDVIQIKTRKRHIVEARQVAMFLAKRNTQESLAKIGSAIGRKDHATVMHACKTVENLLETDRQFRQKWMPLIIS